MEPQGYTKLSSLGVEQQRVKVVISLDEVPEKLGAGFRLTARFITDKKDGVLLVPRYSVMESCDGRRYVLVRQNEVYAKRYVETGLSNETHFEIRDGLSEGEEIVATPSAKMAEEAKED
ncbi:MAG: hypothetical protein U5N86_04190 [Planctomycetota bacterium]|nr:hypothetical protein [Planctomycetota bacterium]